MKITALIGFFALAMGAVDSGAAERFRPAVPEYVVLRVPARAQNDPISVLEQQHVLAPADQQIAAELAGLYVERAREQREARYFGRAETLLQPWVTRADASTATLRVQADILQNRHDFSGALRLLDTAVERDPRDAGARLMRASVRMVQGRFADARGDCAAVLASGESAAGTICLAQVLAGTGRLAQGEALLKQVLARDGAAMPAAASTRDQTLAAAASMHEQALPAQTLRRDSALSARTSGRDLAPPAGASMPERALSAQVRGWALWLQADFADRRGDARAAEAFLRDALRAEPSNEGIRSTLGDLLLARGALREALGVLDLRAPSTGLLVRRAHIQKLLGDKSLSATRAQIDDLLELARRRGAPPHLREEALLALDVDGDAQRALQLAKENFATQRETIDARLLIRAARAAGDSNAIADVAHWMRDTGFEDEILAGIRT